MFGNSVEVAAEDGVSVRVPPSLPAEVLSEREQGLWRHPLDGSPVGIAVVEQVRIAEEFLVEVGVVEGEIAADTHVVDAN